jgi:hypothetical protein
LRAIAEYDPVKFRANLRRFDSALPQAK